MKIVFTICSNNYLSQAKTLGDSVLKHNPDYKFIIGLCDKINKNVDYTPFNKFDILPLEDIGIPNIEWMVSNYNIIELNTAIKPFYFQHLCCIKKDLEIVIYLDPDIMVFDSLSSIENEIKEKTAVLTPHIESPYPEDSKYPKEEAFLNYGIYNLGFIAIRPSEEANKLLKWWSDWLSKKSFDRVQDGLFVDQLPMNFAPIFFKDIIVTKNKGLNFAYWNFHERTVSVGNDHKYWVNNSDPLIFMHFSAFKPIQPIEISRYQTRFNLKDNLALDALFKEYTQLLIENKYFELKLIPCYYLDIYNEKIREQEEVQKKNESLKNKIKRMLYS